MASTADILCGACGHVLRRAGVNKDQPFGHYCFYQNCNLPLHSYVLCHQYFKPQLHGNVHYCKVHGKVLGVAGKCGVGQPGI